MPVNSKSQPDAAMLRRMLYYLKLTRAAEERIERALYRQGKIVGGVYVGRGQEAIAVASTIQLNEGDVTLPCHRDFAAFVIRGFNLPDIFANWMARGESPTRGRENTLHLGDMTLGVIPIISPLGATCPVACGVAMVLKRRGRRSVALVHFGEGTTSVGDVHEAMNFAAVHKLPLVFICNNNQYAYSTPTELQYAVKSLASKGPSYGMPGESIDGTDVLAIYESVQHAIARARSGGGPGFIECRTFRMTGHSAHDAAEYVPRELFEEWSKRDPINLFEKRLLSKKIMTRGSIEELDRKIREEIDAAVADAEARAMPEGASAVAGVYCEPECWWQEKRP